MVFINVTIGDDLFYSDLTYRFNGNFCLLCCCEILF